MVIPAQWAPSIILVARSLTTLAILCGLFVTTYQIMQRHPMVNMLYLTYPYDSCHELRLLYLSILPKLDVAKNNRRDAHEGMRRWPRRSVG